MRRYLSLGLIVLFCIAPVAADAVCPDELELRDHPQHLNRLDLHPDCDLHHWQETKSTDNWSAAVPDLEVDVDIIESIGVQRAHAPSEEATTRTLQTEIAWRIQFTWNLAKLFETKPGRSH